MDIVKPFKSMSFAINSHEIWTSSHDGYYLSYEHTHHKLQMPILALYIHLSFEEHQSPAGPDHLSPIANSGYLDASQRTSVKY